MKYLGILCHAKPILMLNIFKSLRSQVHLQEVESEAEQMGLKQAFQYELLMWQAAANLLHHNTGPLRLQE